MPNLSDLAGYGRDFLQGASNAAASNISAPVDGLAWLLKKGGMNIQNPVGGSDWMAQQGLTQQPQNRLAGILGESVGGVAPIIAAAKAPQIANRMMRMGDNLNVPPVLNKQTGVVYAGENKGADYQASHRPMTVEGGASPLHDLEPTFGKDIYTKNAMQYFGSGDEREKYVLKVMNQVRGNPNAMVNIYRGVPEGITTINKGDWVALHPDYAGDYGHKLTMQVPASHITSSADSISEFGYHPPN